MGNGEDYKYDWWNYVESLPSDFESRLNILNEIDQHQLIGLVQF